MYAQPNKVHQKLVSLPDPLYTRLVKRAEKVGVSFSEYLRLMAYLHLNSPEPFEYVEEIEDEETVKNVAESLKDLAEGRFTVLRNRKEIKEHFNNL